MCCFSRPVNHIGNTRIFARATGHDGQYLAYQMTVQADQPVAMILPLPVPPGSPENAVRFINLEAFPDFFDVLHQAFPPPPPSRSMTHSVELSNTLKVVQVGSFVASFVPRIADFSRLAPEFRLPTDVWDKLPGYRDFGFAVFQLKPGEHRIHPMAFEFPRRDSKHLFFPTVHIHDEHVYPVAHFDHELFLQRGPEAPISGWVESPALASTHLTAGQIHQAQDLIEPNHHLYRTTLLGTLPNQDTLV